MKKNFYSLHGDAVDANGEKHVVTVVGELICDHENKNIEWDADVTLDEVRNKIVPGKISFKKKVLHRKLTVGTAICCPRDEFDVETGVKLAKSRIRKGLDAGVLETNSVTMLTTDQVYAILLNKLKWICDHIDMYISENEEAEAQDENTDVENNTPEDTESTLEEDAETEVDNSPEEEIEDEEDTPNEPEEDNTKEETTAKKSYTDDIPSFAELCRKFEELVMSSPSPFTDWRGMHKGDKKPNSCKSSKKSKSCQCAKDNKSIFSDDIDDFIFGY